MTSTGTSSLHKIAFVLLVIGAFCFGLSATAGAKPYDRDTEHVERGERRGIHRAMARFDRLDLNGDGVITRVEFRTVLRNFIDSRRHDGKGKRFNGKGKRGKGKGHWKRDKRNERDKRNRRGRGGVIRDHRTDTIAPIAPFRTMRLFERVPSRRGQTR